MFGALVISFIFLNKEAKKITAVIGGIGFGVFIDELGKFITSNNDYFYQPTIALIYVVFILIFLSMRLGKHFVRISVKCYAINAIEVIKEVILYDLDKSEKKRALSLLKLSDKNNLAVIVLKKLLQEIDALPLPKPDIFSWIKRSFSDFYIKIISFEWFNKFLIYFFVFDSLWKFTKAILGFKFSVSFMEISYLFSIILSGLLVLLGVYYVRRNKRLLAYEMFKSSVMVSIFLTQFFLFYQEQLSAIIYLFFNITIFAALQYSLNQERIITNNL